MLESLPIPLMWSVARSRGSQENHAVQIGKNLISVCLGNVIWLLKCSPWKRWPGTWEGKVIGYMLTSSELCDNLRLGIFHMTPNSIFRCGTFTFFTQIYCISMHFISLPTTFFFVLLTHTWVFFLNNMLPLSLSLSGLWAMHHCGRAIRSNKQSPNDMSINENKKGGSQVTIM